MTKKELLESEAFKALPNDAEIVFRTSKDFERWVPLTPQQCWLETKWTNTSYLRDIPTNVRPEISFNPELKCFFVIDAMPLDYMEKELNITFNL